MADGSDGRKDREQNPKSGDTNVPPPWAAAMAGQIVEDVQKGSQASSRVSVDSSPGTLGKSHLRTHINLETAHKSSDGEPG